MIQEKLRKLHADIAREAGDSRQREGHQRPFSRGVRDAVTRA